jgi:hypothetical protein
LAAVALMASPQFFKGFIPIDQLAPSGLRESVLDARANTGAMVHDPLLLLVQDLNRLGDKVIRRFVGAALDILLINASNSGLR